MNKEIHLFYAGMDLSVGVEFDKNGEIAKVTRVRAWDEEHDKYVKIPCDLDAFLRETEVFLRGAK